MNAEELRQIEMTLQQIWSDVLAKPVDQIPSHVGFFAVGGDSLLALEVMDRVNASFFAETSTGGLPVTDFFTYGTIRELTRRVAARRSSASP